MLRCVPQTMEDSEGNADNSVEEINQESSITDADPCSPTIRRILDEENPDLDNPGLYNCSVCKKGFNCFETSVRQ